MDWTQTSTSNQLADLAYKSSTLYMWTNHTSKFWADHSLDRFSICIWFAAQSESRMLAGWIRLSLDMYWWWYMSTVPSFPSSCQPSLSLQQTSHHVGDTAAWNSNSCATSLIFFFSTSCSLNYGTPFRN